MAGRYGLKGSDRGVVVRVKPGSPAEEAGVREGDLVLEVNRKSVGTVKSYEQVAANLPKGPGGVASAETAGASHFI